MLPAPSTAGPEGAHMPPCVPFGVSFHCTCGAPVAFATVSTSPWYAPQSPARPPQTITTLLPDTARALRSCCTLVSMPDGVTSRLYEIEPLGEFTPARR